ncbi:MAG: hypothetical protein NT062_33055 [Proteobacteria bacterium]|nr:hypothetical protein [Pseudomonadota bacterium]
MLVAVSALGARVADAAPLGPPPDGNLSGQGKAVRRFLLLYANYAQDPNFCVISQRSAKGSFERNAEIITQLPPEDAALLGPYFRDQFLPYFAPHFDGVPGLGTYDEIVARREASMAWLKANKAKGPAATPADIVRYTTEEKTYAARVHADHVWTEQLFAASACIRWAARSSMEGGKLYELGIYRRSWVNEQEALAQIHAARDALLPTLAGTQGHAPNVLKQIGGATSFASSSDLGVGLIELAGAVTSIDGETPAVATLQIWIANLVPSEAKRLRALLDERDKLRADLVAVFDRLLPTMGLPVEVKDGAGTAQMKKLIGKGALASRVIGKLESFDYSTTDAGNGMEYNRPVRFAGKHVTFTVVAKDPPFADHWPTGLGAAAGPLCHATSFEADFYSAGQGKTLHVWELNGGTAMPIQCARKTATYAP